MDMGTGMLACTVIAAICGLIMYHIRKDRSERLEKAIKAEDGEAITKAYSYGIRPYVIALIICAISAGILLFSILALAFGYGTIHFFG